MLTAFSYARKFVFTPKKLRYGEYRDTVMISESGAYTVLAHHYIPENRSLRQWLTYEVIAVMRDAQGSGQREIPQTLLMNWTGRSLCLLHWQSEPWIRLRDMPEVLGKIRGMYAACVDQTCTTLAAGRCTIVRRVSREPAIYNPGRVHLYKP